MHYRPGSFRILITIIPIFHSHYSDSQTKLFSYHYQNYLDSKQDYIIVAKIKDKTLNGRKKGNITKKSMRYTLSKHYGLQNEKKKFLNNDLHFVCGTCY